MSDLTPLFLEETAKIVKEKYMVSNATELAPYLREERGMLENKCSLVVKPGNAEEIANIMKLCSKHHVSITPIGGNTGLVGGTVANSGILLSLERLNKIVELDAINHTMTVEAGCILATIQAAAKNAGCLFPISLGAEGSCQIGGNISTNAGGVSVLYYGNTRDLVLGLEVVLPDGRIYEGLDTLRKDNTGYDLKQLFIGAEGTLGVVTKAVIKLYPLPDSYLTTFTAFDKLDDVLKLFDKTRARCADSLKAFELVPRLALELGIKHIPGITDPFNSSHPYYSLLQFTSLGKSDDLRENVEDVLGKALTDEYISDAVIAESQAQAAQLWKIREEIPAAQSLEGGSIKHDISIPLSSTVTFIKEAINVVEQKMPGIRACPFGHIGDGNIHFNLTQPEKFDKEKFQEHQPIFNRLIHDLVVEMGGSISAEHGIGLAKRDELHHYSSRVKIQLMQQLKKAIDPKNLMNPDKIILLED